MAKQKKQASKKKQSSKEDLAIDSIYSVINYVQINKKEHIFKALIQDLQVVEHILEDCQIQFSKTLKDKVVTYKLMPPPEQSIMEEAFIFNDNSYSDEILEEGQCF